MKKSSRTVLTFMRRNALYLILAACILAVGLSITLMLVNRNGADNQIDNPPVVDTTTPDDSGVGTITPDNPDDTSPVQKPVQFIMPVESPVSINEYSESMVWCSTLNRFQSHLAVDFFAEEGTDVFAVYDGRVENVETTLLHGVTITIDHGNGLKSVYNSLADTDEVFIGQSVKQGDKIGEVSVTNRQEYKEGAHLHFEVMENDAIIDPAKYLSFNEK